MEIHDRPIPILEYAEVHDPMMEAFKEQIKDAPSNILEEEIDKLTQVIAAIRKELASRG
jgi:hypothetical protein